MDVLPDVPVCKDYGAGKRMFNPLVLEKKRGDCIRFRGNPGAVSAFHNHYRGRNFCSTVSDADTDCACEDAGLDEWNDRN